MKTDIEIAQGAELRPITEIAAKVGLAADDIIPYGRYKAKVPLEVARGDAPSRGKLILVAGINPTPAGEGKSTIAVGLADALTLREHHPVLCLREPSLGPVFGIKGGATGGGWSQVVPMADINLHFNGDFHAITAAHGLLSAMLDNHLFRPNSLDIDPRRVTWRRAVDMNDRALRQIVVGLGGLNGGLAREDGFVITAASEVMAIFALASGVADLEKRLGDIIVGFTRSKEPVRARELKAEGAMTLLLKDALAPNLVQTLGGTPTFIHAGPFGNIAHGCNSIIATKTALQLGDYVVTEAGFGADLGAEKFFDIKCRVGGLEPDVAVVVATIRALKMHGGVPKKELDRENVAALEKGLENLEGHVENIRKFGVPPIVGLNRFASDTDAEVEAVLEACRGWGVPAAEADPWGRGGEGVLELADAVVALANEGLADFTPLYPLELPLAEKIETIAQQIYGADGVDYLPAAKKQLAQLEAIGLGGVPICMAKTQYSFSDDPGKLGRPRGFRITVREVTPSAGAGFVVVKTGDIMTMPGLAEHPAAEAMKVEEDGTILGLF
ncbi:MAG TPA: formate--tetrahydrofolate ligase [Longimicrobiales bacterium]|nr:formate--tetrahydrofolate ligase [Longimicrobiales bacterium]